MRVPARRLAAYFTVGAYTVGAPFGAAIAVVLISLWRRNPVTCARRMQRITAGAYRCMHDWLRLVRICDFDYRTALPDRPAAPCVVVANHPTLMDVTAISAVFAGGFTIVKPELHGRRLLHPFMVGAGHVAGAGNDPLSSQRVVHESVERLGQGFPLVVFPEGTRSPPGRLRPFGRTAFEIACRAGVPVVSVTIECEPVYLSKDVTVFRPPDPTARLRLALLAVDHPADSGSDSRVLRERVEGRFQAWCADRRLAGGSSPR